MACGPSIANITEEEWKFLEDKNTISFSRFPYSSRKTKYYLSIERDYLDREVLGYMAKLGYIDTTILLSIKDSLILARELGFKYIRKIVKKNFYFMPSRQPWFVDKPKPPHSFYTTRAKNFHQPLFRYRGQLTAVINACIILGATEIRLCGVDMNNQINFYDTEYLDKWCKDKGTVERYREYIKKILDENRKEIKGRFKEFDPNTMHSTNVEIKEEYKYGNRPMRGTIDLLEWMNDEMITEGMEGIYITNKDSKPYKINKLRYKGIMDE
jgi:hypothetical protein